MVFHKLTHNEQIAWAAGIVDGEGSIMIHKAKSGRSKSHTYSPTVRVGMTSKTGRQVCEILQSLFGGRINKTTYNNHWKDLYLWTISCNQVENPLRELLPYLVVKKEQALIVLKFINDKRCISKHYGVKGVPLEVTAAREKYNLKIKKLNKRGNNEQR